MNEKPQNTKQTVEEAAKVAESKHAREQYGDVLDIA